MGTGCGTHGEMINAYKILDESPKGRNRLEDRGIDGNIIL
jgi:hypothetical protein